MKTHLALILLVAGSALAEDAHRAVEPRDFFVYSCVREFAKAHALPLYDSSTGYAVEYGRMTPEEMSRLYDAAKVFALTLRAPDMSDEEHGGVAVMAQCMEEARSTRVDALIHKARKTDSAAAAPVVVTLVTSAGEIDVEVLAKQAPLSAADFLRYVDGGLYDGATFYRVVRKDNDHGTPQIEVIQGGLADDAKALPPIAHETTRATGIRHSDGTVSIARGDPGTGSAAAFFVCLGDQPALDFGGMRNPDGQGFAAFGRVVRGMKVVRAIQAMPAEGDSSSEYMKGQMLSKPVIIQRAYRKR